MFAWLFAGLIGLSLGIGGTWLGRRLFRPDAPGSMEPGVRNIARGLAHEIRNPLNSMSITLQLLEEDIEAGQLPKPEELREQIARVRAEVGRLDRILSDFQRYSRLMQTRRDVVDVTRLVSEVLDFVAPEAERQQVEIVRQLEPVPATKADAALLRQVFLNLIVNAFQAMDEGGRLTVATRPTGVHIEVRFTDTGEGIAPDARARIFEPFYSTKKEGTGLGLAVVKQVVDLHGGTVEVHSEPERGAQFTLLLPQLTQDNPL